MCAGSGRPPAMPVLHVPKSSWHGCASLQPARRPGPPGQCRRFRQVPLQAWRAQPGRGWAEATKEEGGVAGWVEPWESIQGEGTARRWAR